MDKIVLYTILFSSIIWGGVSCSKKNSIDKEIIDRFNIFLINHGLMSQQDMIVIYFPPSTCEPCLNSVNSLIKYLEKDLENKVSKILISYPTSENLLFKPKCMLYYSADYKEFERNGLNLSGSFIIFISKRNIIHMQSITESNLKSIQKRILRFMD